MSWNDAVVTQEGINMLLASLEGHKITITCVHGGNKVSAISELEQLTDVVGDKREFGVLKIEDVEQGKKILIQITNQNILDNFVLRQIGIIATLDDNVAEKMLCILQDDRGIEIPSQKDNPDFLLNIYAILSISNDANIAIKIDTNMFASIGYVDENIQKVNDNIELVVDKIQEQLDKKQATITGGASTITSSNLTANRALISNGSGKVAVSAVTSTELGYLDGVTSNVQTQLNGKAASSHGTHVTYSTDAPKVAGTASAGSASTVARSDHVHPAQTTVSGNAGSATKLATARTIRTNLASTSTASFNGTANITPGVTGVLGVANGGTGADTEGEATNNLAAMSLAPGVAIPDKSDLDDYVDPGCFYCSSGTNAATIVNTPVTGSGFMLSVIKTYGLAATSAYRTQFILTYNGAIYVRYRDSSSVWSSWDKWDTTGNNYYPTTWAWTAGTTAGPTAKLTGTGMSTVSVAAIPSASASTSGIITTGAQTIAGTKTFSSTISGNISGNAGSATKLATSRTIQTNLGSTTAASFNGTANVTPGVTGTLPVANGGTGATTAANARTALGAQATITGGASTITSSNLTANRALVSNGSGKVAVSPITSTELGYLDGATGNIQDQINYALNFVSEESWYFNSAGKNIPSDSDLNDYITIGNYFGLRSDSMPIINYPPTAPNGTYFLKVMRTSNSSGSVCQVYIDISTGRYYFRTYSDVADSWTIWNESALKADINLYTLGINVTSKEINYLDGVTSNIQTQLDNKQNTIAGAATTITDSNLTSSRALVSSGSGKVSVSPITSTELGYLDGVTSNIQTQLNGKAASSHGTHVTFTTTVPKASGTAAVGTATTVSRSDHVHPAQTSVSGNAGTATKLATARTVRTNLGSTSTASFDGSANITPGVTGTLPVANGGTGATTAANARTNLGAQATITGGASTITASNLTVNRALISNGSGKVAVSAVTATELGYLDGVTSNVQTQLNGKAASSHGTHVTYSTAAPKANGTAAAGTAATVARSDHVHPATPAASTTTAGIVTADDQHFGGIKTFDGIVVEGSLELAGANARIELPDSNISIPNSEIDLSESEFINMQGSAVDMHECNIDMRNASVDISGEGNVIDVSGCVIDVSGCAIDTNGGTIDSAQLGYLKGVTSNIQTQLNGKAASSHGTHVTYSTTAPKAAGTASAGTASTVARSDHVHPAQTTVSGNAGSATKLAAARTIRTNLGSESATGFDGSANITPGVTGTLPVAHGGTGGTTAAAARTNLGAAEGYYKSATVSTAGWYRIATSAASISNNIGVFSVKAAVNGKHSNVVLAAGISYGDNPDIVQILASNYSTASLTKARLVYHGTYNNNYAYLEVYLNISASTTVDVNMALCEGWTLVAPNTAGSIPSGYTSKECVIANGGIGGYTASRALVTNSSGVVTESAVTSTELGYLDGVTSAIQTQLNGKAAASHGTHVSFSTTAPKAAGTAAVGTATTVARSDHVHPAQTTVSGNAGTATKLATARTIRTNLGSTSTASFNGTANVTPGVTGTLPVANGGTGATTAANARTNLGAQATITGGASTITASNLTVNRALISNGSGKVAVSAVTSTELGYLDGVTSNIQTQINSINTQIGDIGSLLDDINGVVI